jgi:hypothetical protein
MNSGMQAPHVSRWIQACRRPMFQAQYTPFRVLLVDCLLRRSKSREASLIVKRVYKYLPSFASSLGLFGVYLLLRSPTIIIRSPHPHSDDVNTFLIFPHKLRRYPSPPRRVGNSIETILAPIQPLPILAKRTWASPCLQVCVYKSVGARGRNPLSLNPLHWSDSSRIDHRDQGGEGELRQPVEQGEAAEASDRGARGRSDDWAW